VGCDIQMAVDARRGYLVCLCTSGDAEPVAIVWDLHSGRHVKTCCVPQYSSHAGQSTTACRRPCVTGPCANLTSDWIDCLAGVQDRTLWGVAAHAHFDHVDSSTSDETVGHKFLWPYEQSPSQPCTLPEGVLISCVAVRQLLASQTAHTAGTAMSTVLEVQSQSATLCLPCLQPHRSPRRDSRCLYCGRVVDASSRTADVATALALLHLWGVDAAVDSLLRALLAELALLQLPLAAEQATETSGAACGVKIQQRPALLPAMISSDTVIMAVPQQQAAASPPHQHQRQQEAQQNASSTGQQRTMPALLEHSPVMAAHRVLAVAALAHRLQAVPQPPSAAVKPPFFGPRRSSCQHDVPLD
jgi:hypothetical protein